MSEISGAAVSGAMIVEEPEAGGGSGGREQAPEQGPLRCGGCTLWPRQQTWLCVVPLLIGFIGLGLSLMLLKWIVVGSVQDYVPTDLVDAKGIGQDPIFLSKPSAVPKLPDTSTSTSTTTTTTTTASAVPPGGTTTVRPRTRAGTRAGGPGASGSQVTPRSTTTRHASAPRGPHPTASGSTTSTMATPTSTPSPSNPTVLHVSTQMWTHVHTSHKPPAVPTRSHVQVKTAMPTSPPLRSEHFKPCKDKDLAYCLNGGECFVIETLTGSHKNCRCKEGYQGVRCDQFLPKTDSILSDPTDHLGIEFMESEEIYKRQVLSVSCIAIGISLLGTICMALYYRNKRRREKLQAHLKSYSVSASGFVSKPSLRPQGSLQLQKYCKGNGSSPPHGGAVHESGFVQQSVALAAHSRVVPTGKHHRSGSLSHSPDQRSRAGHRAAPRRTPPISRGRLNPMGGSRDSGPAYQHLQEAESSEREVESLRGHHSEGTICDPRQDSYLNMQRPLCAGRASQGGLAQVPCSRLDGGVARAAPGGFRCAPLRCSASPPPYRTCSVPIIPSVQGHYDDTSCMQTASGGTGGGPSDACQRSSSSPASTSSSSSSSQSKGAEQQEAVALLLDEAHQQLRELAHAHRKQEDTGSIHTAARETACFLSLTGGEVGGLALSGPPETRLVNPSREPHRDSAQPCE
ncbi:pro-neuregulin-3, membrane-bound isoform [Anguilla anguilla]|uniref:pro-neuregulin-3, membrane-bound isoform n=1 Tax=Anguilla anguilla TaxID=7936 RepID=UPI0015AD3760|nr:pro-neuregulin-3, membrane-bound isoform [Anguilla anguilla]XP_035256327.1 pro-neuregulin-3, membrane-bound isoform [Anguilla anguilla]